VEEHRVAGLGVEASNRIEPDDVPGLEGRGIDEPAAGHDLRDRLRAEPVQAGGAGQLGDGEAAVGAVAHLQVPERVEVGPELRRRREDLRDPGDVVVPEWRERVRVVRRRDERLAKVAAREDGRLLVEHMAELVEPAIADE
jgi:hypothetical protein